ncbi:hypothetical protein HMSSN036_12100 [Paenibacillus macerans]|nr:hypothetical protein HMSSN036_12100 [Paenibacillus macerans]
MLDTGYFIKFDPFHNRIAFDMWPRTEPGFFQWQIAGDKPQMIELERPFRFAEHNRISIKLILEDDILCLYVNDMVAMTTRIYNFKTGHLGFSRMKARLKFKTLGSRPTSMLDKINDDGDKGVLSLQTTLHDYPSGSGSQVTRSNGIIVQSPRITSLASGHGLLPA